MGRDVSNLIQLQLKTHVYIYIYIYLSYIYGDNGTVMQQNYISVIIIASFDFQMFDLDFPNIQFDLSTIFKATDSRMIGIGIGIGLDVIVDDSSKIVINASSSSSSKNSTIYSDTSKFSSHGSMVGPWSRECLHVKTSPTLNTIRYMVNLNKS